MQRSQRCGAIHCDRGLRGADAIWFLFAIDCHDGLPLNEQLFRARADVLDAETVFAQNRFPRR